jgi:hypothetical protein
MDAWALPLATTVEAPSSLESARTSSSCCLRVWRMILAVREDGMRASYGVYTLCPFVTVARKSSV